MKVKVALVAAVLGIPWPFSAWAAAPGAFEESACFALQTKCRVGEDGKADVLCDRPAFSKALLSCVDLWEAEELCAENLSASRDLYSIDLETWTMKLGELEEQRDAMRLRSWVWGVLGVIGWGVAAGLFVWSATR